MISSAGLHFLISQSLFATATEVLPSNSQDGLADPLAFQIAYSTQALLTTLILACIAVLVPLALSLRQLPSHSIIVGTNSAAISAQCHHYEGATDTGNDTEITEPRQDILPAHVRSDAGVRSSHVENQPRNMDSEAGLGGDTQTGAEHGETQKLLFEIDPSSQLWHQKLQWGVLIGGSTAANRPGHLGIYNARRITGNPTKGHFYK